MAEVIDIKDKVGNSIPKPAGKTYPMISREDMKKIRSYNRDELSSFLADWYNNGYNGGVQFGFQVGAKSMMQVVEEAMQGENGVPDEQWSRLTDDINAIIKKNANQGKESTDGSEEKKEESK